MKTQNFFSFSFSIFSESKKLANSDREMNVNEFIIIKHSRVSITVAFSKDQKMS